MKVEDIMNLRLGEVGDVVGLSEIVVACSDKRQTKQYESHTISLSTKIFVKNDITFGERSMITCIAKAQLMHNILVSRVSSGIISQDVYNVEKACIETELNSLIGLMNSMGIKLTSVSNQKQETPVEV